MTKKLVPTSHLIVRRVLKRAGDVDRLSKTPDIRWDFLQIQAQDGEIMAISAPHAKNTQINLTYRGLTFLATPGYGADSTISVEWNSLVKFVEEG